MDLTPHSFLLASFRMPVTAKPKKKAWTDEELEKLPREQVHIYDAIGIKSFTASTDILTGGEVRPGFKGRLGRIFHPL